jgi:hypothetical protein
MNWRWSRRRTEARRGGTSFDFARDERAGVRAGEGLKPGGSITSLSPKWLKSAKFYPQRGFSFTTLVLGGSRVRVGKFVSDRRQSLDRVEDLLCEASLFVVDLVALVAGIFYYIAIGFTLIAACRFPAQRHVDPKALSVRDFGIVNAIELCVGTALLWGLAHVVGHALDRRQASRSLGISSTKLQGR